MKDVRAFLKRNGFKKMEKNSYANEFCNVGFQSDGCFVVVGSEKGEEMYSSYSNIYWLIGYLTYSGYLNKDYIS